LSKRRAQLKKRITGGYIRLTRDESLRKNLSAPAQKSDITDYVQRGGLLNLEFFEETKPVGGDTPFEKRPEGKRLIAKCQAGEVGDIVVRDIDRLTRDLPLWIYLDELCQDKGITIHTLSGPLHTKSPSDRFASYVRAAAAQLEKEQTGDRNRRSKRQLAIKGLPVGGPPAYGYMTQARRRRDLINTGLSEEEATVQAQIDYTHPRKLYQDETEAPAVRLMFELYVRDGLGSRRIATELNNRGFRRRSGKPWLASRINRMLHNPVYAGFIPFDEDRYARGGRGPFARQSQQTLYTGKHEPLVDEATWRAALEILQSRTSPVSQRGDATVSNRRHALSGVIECRCGETMRSGSVQQKGKKGSYVCRKRFQYGTGAIGGCDGPRVSLPETNKLFWQTVQKLILTDGLVDRVFEAAKKIESERREPATPTVDPEQQRAQLTADIDVWYARHDTATSDIEKEAAWQRIVQLMEQREQLEIAASEEPVPTQAEVVRHITREQIAKHLRDLATSIPRTRDGGVALVATLIKHHGLRVQLQDEGALVVSLSFGPPGLTADQVVEHSIELQTLADYPRGKVDEWLEQNKGSVSCRHCGKPVEVRRWHYWNGLPSTHKECALADASQKRANPAPGLLNGVQVARLLGIGRTTLGRWMKSGKLKPVRKEGGVLLFDEAEAKRLAATFDNHRNDPDGEFLNGRQVANRLGISRSAVGRLMKAGSLVPARRQQNLCLFRMADVKALEKSRNL
jgi:DNA invertase Pin-like site-specific DNA recombinase/predicted DNA-binding transcriptional regulator AlpA